MLIESASPAPTSSTDDRSVPAPMPPASVAGTDQGTAERERTFERATRALEAIDVLARDRRSRELVLALERLGAGLDATIDALDSAMDPTPPTPVAADPAPAPWIPISKPLVPITAPVVDPTSGIDARPAPVPAALPAEPEAPAVRPMRQAPAGLARHVIDFSA
jgi:hypothetical protein